MTDAVLTKLGAVSIRARSLDIPTDAHPNKMPFSGILTRIGEPSDAAPDGSNGKRVMITHEAAERSLDSLLGMAVDYQADFAGHDPQAKIGVITAATIDGNAIRINGFIYAADFPELAKEIKANKEFLGFSFEARDLLTNAPDSDPVPIVDCVFTGAAILLKEKAAYRTTSLAAKAAESDFNQEDIIMTDDLKTQLAEIVAAAVKPVADAVAEQGKKLSKMEADKIEAANFVAKVEPHAGRLEDAADRMEDAGIGGHPTAGHAAVLRRMAGCMRADAAQGKMPHIFEGTGWMGASKEPVHASTDDTKKVDEAVAKASAEFTKKLDEMKAEAEKKAKDSADALASAETKLKDLQAKADAAEAATGKPERKTVSVEASMFVSKHGLEPGQDGKLDSAKLNAVFASSGLTPEKRIELKTHLHRAGLIA